MMSGKDPDSLERGLYGGIVGPLTLVVCVLAAVCTLGVALLAYWQFDRVLTGHALDALEAHNAEAGAFFAAEVAEARRDTVFLAAIPTIARIPLDDQPGDATASLEAWRERARGLFVELLNAKPRYQSIRYLRKRAGWVELIGAERAPGSAARAAASAGRRLIFLDQLDFDRADAQLPAIDLSNRDGAGVHVAVAVRNRTGEPFGAIVLTLSVSAVFQEFEHIQSPSHRLAVATPDGQALDWWSPAPDHADGPAGPGIDNPDEPLISTFPELREAFTTLSESGQWRAILGSHRQRAAVTARAIRLDPGNPDGVLYFAAASPYASLTADALQARNFTLAGGAALLFLALAAGLASMYVAARQGRLAPHPERDTPQPLPLAAAALMAGIFLLDLNRPLGAAIGVLYAIPVLLSVVSWDGRSTLLLALAGSLLTILAFVFGPTAGAAEFVLLLNRGLSIAIVWGTALLGIHVTRIRQELSGLNQQLEQKARQRANSFRAGVQLFQSLFQHVPLGICGIDTDGHLVNSNPAMHRMLGYPPEELAGLTIRTLVHPDELESLHDSIERMQRGGTTVELESRFRCSNGTYRWLHWVAAPVTRSGQVYCTVRDTTASRQERDEVESRLQEKEAMLREIHHRVKNNLQIVSSLLSLHSRQGDAGAASVFRECQQRIEAMALIHERLYQSENMTEVDLADYLTELTTRQLHAMGGTTEIRVQSNMDALTTSLDVAIPLGLIANELITNCRKHAFVGRSTGTVSVSLHVRGTSVVFEVADDGVGSPGLADDHPGHLGLRLVRILADQLGANLELSGDGIGATVRLKFDSEQASRRAEHG